MKKVLLTAALGCATLAPAFAAGNNTASHNGSLQVVVNDYITMVPSGGFAAGPWTYSTPADMVAGTAVSNTVTIVASRAWKYEYSATDFVRDPIASGPAGPGVAGTVPVGNIWTVMTGSGSAGVNTYNGSYIAASNSPVNMANEGTGTLTSTFTLAAKMVPGLTNQMSGTYNSSITQIASLD